MIKRRSFITGLIALVAAPAIVRAGSLMPVKQMVEPIRQFMVGDIVTISGVEAWDSIKGKPTGYPRQFVVTAQCSSSELCPPIYPPLNDSGHHRTVVYVPDHVQVESWILHNPTNDGFWDLKRKLDDHDPEVMKLDRFNA